jgi:hypothetical protein
MTVQLSEPIFYRDAVLHAREYPLNDYFARTGIANPFGEESRGRSSLCWNGYVASWTIEDGRLYLKEIIDFHGEGVNVLNLETIFPGYADGVFAHWYSGKMKFPQGEVIKRGNSTAPSIFERDWTLVFCNGLLVSEEVVSNNVTVPDKAEIAENISLPSGIIKVDKDNNLQLMPVDLLAKQSCEEIEIAETPQDPLHRAPAVPFGFMNTAWKLFIEQLPAEAEIRPFQIACRVYYWLPDDYQMCVGYAGLINGQVTPIFVSQSYAVFTA